MNPPPPKFSPLPTPAPLPPPPDTQKKNPPTQRSCRGVGAQHAAPLRALWGYPTRIVNPTLPARPPLPGLRLPLGRRRLGPGATLAVFVHAVIVGVLVEIGRAHV